MTSLMTSLLSEDVFFKVRTCLSGRAGPEPEARDVYVCRRTRSAAWGADICCAYYNLSAAGVQAGKSKVSENSSCIAVGSVVYFISVNLEL